jgi:hypothetical protein
LGESSEQIRSNDEIQKLAQLKKFLEEKIEAMNRELESLRAISQIVDRELVGRSFRRGTGEPISPISQPARPSPAPIFEPVQAPPPAQVLEEKKIDLVYRGRLVGYAYVSTNVIRILPDEKFKLKTTISPFESFLLRKILDEMREKDTERAGRGEIRPDQILSYDVVEDNTFLKEIVISNYGDSERLNRILRATAWTLMVMSQK